MRGLAESHVPSTCWSERQVPSGLRMTKGRLGANEDGAVATSRLHPRPVPQICVSAVVTNALRVSLPALLSLQIENKGLPIATYNAHGLPVSLNLSTTTTCAHSQEQPLVHTYRAHNSPSTGLAYEHHPKVEPLSGCIATTIEPRSARSCDFLSIITARRNRYMILL